MKYILNDSGSSGTWEGQTIAHGEYFALPSSQIAENFSNSDAVIASLSSGDLKASKTNDSSGHIASVGDAINFLKGNLERVTNYPFASKTLQDGRKIYKRVHGVTTNVPAGQTVNIDLAVPYGETKFTGAEILGCALGDSVNFKVLDDASGTYSTVPYYILNQFGFNVKMPPTGYYKNESNYDASLFVGMILRCEYTNNAGSAVDISMNVWLHEVV